MPEKLTWLLEREHLAGRQAAGAEDGENDIEDLWVAVDENGGLVV